LDWALTQELQHSKVTQCKLENDFIFIIKIIIGLPEIVNKSKLEVEQSKAASKIQKFD